MHEITLVPPFPAGEGAGDRGQGSKLKAGQAGDKESTPPGRYSGGKVSRQPTGQAPLRHLSGRVSRPKEVPPPHFFTFSPCQRRADVIQYAIESETV